MNKVNKDMNTNDAHDMCKSSTKLIQIPKESSVSDWKEKNNEFINGYHYALGLMDMIKVVNQPLSIGMLSGKYEKLTSENIIPNLISDVKSMGREIVPTKFEEECPDGMDKIVVFWGQSEFTKRVHVHFYKEDKKDKNGQKAWSHKLGSNPVSIYDADNKLITNPEESNRKFDNYYNYKNCLGYFLISSINPADPKVNELYTGGLELRKRMKEKEQEELEKMKCKANEKNLKLKMEVNPQSQSYDKI